ncbi:MAG: ABC transporter permease [Rhodothermaceae bacterium]|nr:ABC transporter permease [Rhodothermaceae bacterium]
MWNRSIGIIALTVQTLRSNPLHTVLSMLGLIIGVGALVSILSLGDSLEQYGRDQISTTTSLEAIIVSSKTVERVDGVTLERDTISTVSLDNAMRLSSMLEGQAQVALRYSKNVEIEMPEDSLRAGAVMYGITPSVFTLMEAESSSGRLLNDNDLSSPSKAVVSRALAQRITGTGNEQELIGTRIPLGDAEAEVIGILSGGEEDESMVVYVPFTYDSYEATKENPPTLIAKANSVEDVNPVKERIEAWLDENKAGGHEAFNIFTYQARIAQMEQGVRVFKLIMGLITGIAVLVGGIGVMNVLLISITERTREIGIRKATGARKRDIVLQFLTEAIAVSILGSLLGVVLGLAFMAVALPVIKNLTEAPPFEIAFSIQSLGIIIVVAILVGIGFGTYPASRAARLSPIDAIRHE